MIINRLVGALRTQNWSTVVLEVLVVVVGIFIGLQVDGWNEERKNRALERRYLERMYSDLTQDIDEMDYGRRLAQSRREMGRLLLNALQEQDVVNSDPQGFINAVEQAGYTIIPAIS